MVIKIPLYICTYRRFLIYITKIYIYIFTVGKLEEEKKQKGVAQTKVTFPIVDFPGSRCQTTIIGTFQ